MPSYSTGISQPAKSTSLAPATTCASYSGVLFSVPASTFATILLAVTLPEEEIIELKRVENLIPHEEAEAQRAFRAP
jgi:hypothetical protein